ncbi:MAG: penicillin-binding protein 2 [Candidatus Omnitrophica bacterium]|nr:penicillin-binding protein 2 [Candidatus Omnitrophota bacterium]
MRVNLVIGLFVCLFLTLSTRFFSLSVMQGEEFRELSYKNCIRLLPQPGARGRIFDRHGVVIADNKLSYDLLLLPQSKNETESTLSSIAGVLGTDLARLRINFRRNFISSSLPVRLVKSLTLTTAIALAQLKTDIPSIFIQPNPQRTYPFGKLACHVLGYVNEIDHWRLTQLEPYGYKTKDIVGFGGIEEKYDYYLRQEEGGFSFEVDHRGKISRTVGFRLPTNGRDIQLTIDAGIQKVAEDNLAQQKGTIIIMDAYNGEILAMANVPGFEPSIFVDRLDPMAIPDMFNDPNAPLLNRAISGMYPPGSIFKAVVGAAALERGKITKNTRFLCEGGTLVGDRKFPCSSIHHSQDIIAALTHSCNVFFYRTGLLLTGSGIYDNAVRFGLGKPTGCQLPYESSGFVPSPFWKQVNKFKKWFDGDTANFSIGQGYLLVTPLQMVRMMAVFANKGALVTPMIVKAIDAKAITPEKKNTSVALNPETIEYIRQGLRGVVSESTGTGHVLSGLALTVAGKTGTAQAPGGQSHAWFVGFFPYEESRYVICVFLENAGSGHLACVVARHVLEGVISGKFL